MRKGEGEALGLTPTESLAVDPRADVVAERRTDLAAKEAMTGCRSVAQSDTDRMRRLER